MCLTEELAQSYQLTPDCDKRGHVYALKTAEGKFHPLLPIDSAAAVWMDWRYRTRELQITARRFPATDFVEVIKFQSWVNNKLLRSLLLLRHVRHHRQQTRPVRLLPSNRSSSAKRPPHNLGGSNPPLLPLRLCARLALTAALSLRCARASLSRISQADARALPERNSHAIVKTRFSKLFVRRPPMTSPSFGPGSRP